MIWGIQLWNMQEVKKSKSSWAIKWNWYEWFYVIFYLLVSEQNRRNCLQKGIIAIDRSDHQIINFIFYVATESWWLAVVFLSVVCCLLHASPHCTRSLQFEHATLVCNLVLWLLLLNILNHIWLFCVVYQREREKGSRRTAALSSGDET